MSDVEVATPLPSTTVLFQRRCDFVSGVIFFTPVESVL